MTKEKAEDYGKECEETVSRQQVLDKFEEKWLKDAKSNSSNTDIAFSEYNCFYEN